MLGLLLLHSYGTHCDHILWHLMATMTTVAPPVDCLWQFGSSFYRCRCKLRGPQNIIPLSSPSPSHIPESYGKWTFVEKSNNSNNNENMLQVENYPSVCVFSVEKCVTKRPFCWLVNEVLEMCVTGRYSHAP